MCRSILLHLNLQTLPPRRPGGRRATRLVSSHPVLPHQRDDAGRRTRLRQEGVFEELAGRGPLSRVPHQHPVQEAFEQRGDLGDGEINRDPELGLLLENMTKAEKAQHAVN